VERISVMEKEKTKSLLKTNTQKPEGEEEKIIAANNSGKTKYIRRLMGFTCALLSFVVISIIAVLIIVLLNNRTPTDVAKINTSIANLANMDSDEERILEIMKIEKDIQSISSDKQSKINASKLSHETSSTINKLKESVEWKDHINNDEKYYLLWSIINCDLINRIEFRKERFGSEMWICNNEDFYNDLLTILDLPYTNLLDNFSDELTQTFSDYSNFYSFTLHLKNNELVDLGVYNGGYVKICIKGTDDEEQKYRIKNCYVSLIKLDTSKFYSFMDDNNLSKYNIESSVISLIVSNYSLAMNSVIGPSMKFNLDDASFECSIDYGSFEYYKEIKSLIVPSNIMVQWAPSYFRDYGTPECTLVDEISTKGKAYMDVIVKKDEKIVGYSVIEMKYVDVNNYIATILESVLFRDDNNSLIEVPLEFVLDKIKGIKEG